MVLPRALSTLPSPDSKTIALSLIFTSIFLSSRSRVGEPCPSLIVSLAPHLPLGLSKNRQIGDVVERHFAAALHGFLGLVDHDPQPLLTSIDVVVVNFDNAVVRRRSDLAIELQPFNQKLNCSVAIGANIAVGLDAGSNHSLDLIGLVLNFLHARHQSRLRKNQNIIRSGKNIKSLFPRLEIQGRSEDGGVNQPLAQRGEARVRWTNGQVLQICFGIESIVPGHGPRREVRDATKDKHGHRFAFERLDRFDFRPRHQGEHWSRHKAGHHFDWHPTERATDGRTTNARRVIDFAATQRRSARSRGDPDDLRFDSLLFQKTSLLRQRKSHELAGESGHRDSNLVGGMNRAMDKKNREQSAEYFIHMQPPRCTHRLLLYRASMKPFSSSSLTKLESAKSSGFALRTLASFSPNSKRTSLIPSNGG